MSQIETMLAAVRDNAKTTASLQNAADRLAAAAESLRANPSRSGSSATININAGGWATMVSCAVAVACMLMQVRGAFAQAEIDSTQSADVRELRAENRRLNDYLSALYRQYPELRPEHLKKGKP